MPLPVRPASPKRSARDRYWMGETVVTDGGFFVAACERSDIGGAGRKWPPEGACEKEVAKR